MDDTTSTEIKEFIKISEYIKNIINDKDLQYYIFDFYQIKCDSESLSTKCQVKILKDCNKVWVYLDMNKDNKNEKIKLVLYNNTDTEYQLLEKEFKNYQKPFSIVHSEKDYNKCEFFKINYERKESILNSFLYVLNPLELEELMIDLPQPFRFVPFKTNLKYCGKEYCFVGISFNKEIICYDKIEFDKQRKNRILLKRSGLINSQGSILGSSSSSSSKQIIIPVNQQKTNNSSSLSFIISESPPPEQNEELNSIQKIQEQEQQQQQQPSIVETKGSESKKNKKQFYKKIFFCFFGNKDKENKIQQQQQTPQELLVPEKDEKSFENQIIKPTIIENLKRNETTDSFEDYLPIEDEIKDLGYIPISIKNHFKIFTTEMLSKMEITNFGQLHYKPPIYNNDAYIYQVLPIFNKLLEILRERTIQSVPVYDFLKHLAVGKGYGNKVSITGGCIRDLLEHFIHGKEGEELQMNDIDIVMSGDFNHVKGTINDYFIEKGISLGKALVATKRSTRFCQFKISNLNSNNPNSNELKEPLDISIFKSYKVNNSLSKKIKCQDYLMGCSYDADALSRDYTMNALYLEPFNPIPHIIDPTGKGLEDIKNKKLRLVCRKRMNYDLGGLFRFWKMIEGQEGYTADDDLILTMSNLLYGKLIELNQLVENSIDPDDDLTDDENQLNPLDNQGKIKKIMDNYIFFLSKLQAKLFKVNILQKVKDFNNKMIRQKNLKNNWWIKLKEIIRSSTPIIINNNDGHEELSFTIKDILYSLNISVISMVLSIQKLE